MLVVVLLKLTEYQICGLTLNDGPMSLRMFHFVWKNTYIHTTWRPIWPLWASLLVAWQPKDDDETPGSQCNERRNNPMRYLQFHFRFCYRWIVGPNQAHCFPLIPVFVLSYANRVLSVACWVSHPPSGQKIPNINWFQLQQCDDWSVISLYIWVSFSFWSTCSNTTSHSKDFWHFMK